MQKAVWYIQMHNIQSGNWIFFNSVILSWKEQFNIKRDLTENIYNKYYINIYNIESENYNLLKLSNFKLKKEILKRAVWY